jgi:hypothetical protein
MADASSLNIRWPEQQAVPGAPLASGSGKSGPLMAKRWNVEVEGTGVALPVPATLHDDLTQRTKGAMRVVEKDHNFAVGAANFYTIEADDSVDKDTIKALVTQSVRVYVPEKATLTVEVKPALE